MNLKNETQKLLSCKKDLDKKSNEFYNRFVTQNFLQKQPIQKL
jgi:hypothetical protein